MSGSIRAEAVKASIKKWKFANQSARENPHHLSIKAKNWHDEPQRSRTYSLGGMSPARAAERTQSVDIRGSASIERHYSHWNQAETKWESNAALASETGASEREPFTERTTSKTRTRKLSSLIAKEKALDRELGTPRTGKLTLSSPANSTGLGARNPRAQRSQEAHRSGWVIAAREKPTGSRSCKGRPRPIRSNTGRAGLVRREAKRKKSGLIVGRTLECRVACCQVTPPGGREALSQSK